MTTRLSILLFLPVFWWAPSVYAVDEDAGTGGEGMDTFVIFFSLTAEGIENIKDSPARVQAAEDAVRALGGEVKAFYGILGSEFDTIFIIEAPNDEVAAKIALAIASRGNVRTQTHRAFTRDEYGKLISELP